jgi:Zn-dependent protease
LLGIPVTVQATFFLIPLIVLQSRDVAGALIWTAVVFFSVLAHELGHALAMRAFGSQPSIVLQMFGGLTLWPDDFAPTAKQRLFVTAGGPLTGLMLGGIALLLKFFVDDPSEHLEMALFDAVWVNIGWSIINLFPMLPFDGGLLLDASAELLTGRPRARWVGVVSIVTGCAVIAGAIYVKMILLAIFAVDAVLHGWRRFKTGGFEQMLESAWAAIRAGQLERGESTLRALVAQELTHEHRVLALHGLAWVLLMRREIDAAKATIHSMKEEDVAPQLLARLAAADNDTQGVIRILTPLSEMLPPEDLALLCSALSADGRFGEVVQHCQAIAARGGTLEPALSNAALRLFQDGAFRESFLVSELAFGHTHDARHAYNAACSLVRQERLDEAMTWLTRAVDAGYIQAATMASDSDLGPLRARDDFQKLIAGLPVPRPQVS